MIGLGAVLFTAKAQDLSGRWEGLLTQDGKAEGFYYELNLQQSGDLYNGTSFSRTQDSLHYARFEVTAILDGRQFVLQRDKDSLALFIKGQVAHIRGTGDIDQTRFRIGREISHDVFNAFDFSPASPVKCGQSS